LMTTDEIGNCLLRVTSPMQCVELIPL